MLALSLLQYCSNSTLLILLLVYMQNLSSSEPLLKFQNHIIWYVLSWLRSVMDVNTRCIISVTVTGVL